MLCLHRAPLIQTQPLPLPHPPPVPFVYNSPIQFTLNDLSVPSSPAVGTIGTDTARVRVHLRPCSSEGQAGGCLDGKAW